MDDTGFPLVITFDDGHNLPMRYTCRDTDDLHAVIARYAEPGTEDEAFDALCPGSPDYEGEFGSGDRLYVDSWDPTPVPAGWRKGG